MNKKIEKLERRYIGPDTGCGGATFSDVIDKINEVIDVLNGEPELRESEGERIRKEIKDIVLSYRSNCVYEGNHHFDECLAWLEKQEKQEFAPNTFEEAVKQMYDEVDVCQLKWKERAAKLFELAKKELEQKPVEISEDIKRTLDGVSRLLIMMNYKETARDYKQAVEKLISMLPQKKEDLPKWKPSDEQMNVLRKYVSGEWKGLTFNEDEHLKSLYNDLKKLKED